jgi:hypothetical protein
MDSGISASNGAEVALEVTEVDRVEADLGKGAVHELQDEHVQNTYNGDPKSDICLSQHTSNKVVVTRQHLLEPIQGIEDEDNCRLVRSLSRGKAGLVHAICSILMHLSAHTQYLHTQVTHC